jgi:hypothetical protein
MAHRSPSHRSPVARHSSQASIRAAAVRPTPPTPVSSDCPHQRCRRPSPPSDDSGLPAAGKATLAPSWTGGLGSPCLQLRACGSGLPGPLDRRRLHPVRPQLAGSSELGRRWRSMRLPMEHRAGQGAGDAVHDLDAGGHQPAQLIQIGRLRPGDDVVGPARSSATWTLSRPLSAWATLPTSVWMSTYGFSIPRRPPRRQTAPSAWPDS